MLESPKLKRWMRCTLINPPKEFSNLTSNLAMNAQEWREGVGMNARRLVCLKLDEEARENNEGRGGGIYTPPI